MHEYIDEYMEVILRKSLRFRSSYFDVDIKLTIPHISGVVYS